MSLLPCPVRASWGALVVVLVFVAGCDPGAPGPCSESASCITSSTGPGSTAVFSKLPPYDVEGAAWVYTSEYPDSGKVQAFACHIANTFTWPDGQPGSTRRCVVDGDVEVDDGRYALYPDRIELRESGTHVYEPPAEVYRVPVQVGDAWEVSSKIKGFPQFTEASEVLAVEPVELTFGSFDAAKVEIHTSSGTSESTSTTWLADGIGIVKSENSSSRTELTFFEVP